MSEIDGPKISVNQVNLNSIMKQAPEPEQTASPDEVKEQIKDFSNIKAETLGRSLLFKGSDNIKNDLKVAVENPEIVENSDKMFELTYSAAVNSNMENPYEEAASASTASF